MHKAIIAQVTAVEPITGADHIQVAYILGERVITSKSVGVGHTGILFPAELQLSTAYCHYNNLFRHSELNQDQSKRGFFDDNRKVRAQPFMKVKSEAYFAELSSLDYISKGVGDTLALGTKFDEVMGEKVCWKWVNPHAKALGSAKQKKARKKTEAPLFHEHVDTEQFKHNAEHIPVGALLSFHAKVHGTSARYSNTKIVAPLSPWKEKINSLLGYEVFKPKEEYKCIAGTRRVVLADGNRDKEGFHGAEAFRYEWLDKLQPYLEPGISAYGELVGYANGKSIMPAHSVSVLKDKAYTKKYGDKIVYKYNCAEHENRFIIYRVTYTTPEGSELDMTVDQLRHWATVRGFESTMEVAPRVIYDGDVDNLRRLVDVLAERPDSLTEDYYDPSHISEGIVVRVDFEGKTPKFYKQKSYAFKCLEGICNVETVDEEEAS